MARDKRRKRKPSQSPLMLKITDACWNCKKPNACGRCWETRYLRGIRRRLRADADMEAQQKEMEEGGGVVDIKVNKPSPLLNDIIGGQSPLMTEDQARHADILERLSRTYAEKNADYGNSASKSYEEFGILSYIIRITDKLNRLKSLTVNKEQRVQDESVVDTLMDLANYSILAVMDIESEERGKK